MEIIKEISIDELFAHTRQREIYGDESLDQSMLESIQERGIITPIIVAQWDDDLEGHIIISGHRRKNHAQALGLETVPCIIRDYGSADEMDLDFLLSNQNREKTIKQRVNEFIAYKQKLSQIGKYRKGNGVGAEQRAMDEAFYSFLKNMDIAPDKPLDSISIIEKVTGFSKYKQELTTIVFDPDYKARKVDELYELARNNGKKFDRDAAYKQLYELEKAVTDEKISLSQAAEQIKQAIKQFEDFVKAEPKAKKLKLVKEEKEKSKSTKLKTSILKIKELQKTNRPDTVIINDINDKGTAVFLFKGRIFEIDLSQLSNEIDSISIAV
jgi:hypothetical protein